MQYLFLILLVGGTTVWGQGCLPGNKTCLPTWEPTWDMYRSTVLYTCNNSGLHNIEHAVKWGIVVYDWSNGKAIWANQHPMDDDGLLLKQAEMLLAADPGVPGQAPRVWVYRNTIKALNWYTSVRNKLDDPKYESWFIKFKDYKGPQSNDSYHVPACDWAPPNPKCSGFYHDQEQTPEHPGGGKDYPVDGDCKEQCDCGPTNPCGEYIFDHRGPTVDGLTLRDWFINEYMISNMTLLHKDPLTGKPQPIGLGWLDDSMTLHGPTEENKYFVEDTGASPMEMKALVDAYQASMLELKKKVIPMGGFWWQLMHTQTFDLSRMNPSKCVSTLRTYCTKSPSSWDQFQMYNVGVGGHGVTPQGFTDYTAAFLLTRGHYALIGYTWCGCTNGAQARPRAKEWDEDYGVPMGGAPCVEKGSGVFEREWTLATVKWDCNAGHGSIIRKTL